MLSRTCEPVADDPQIEAEIYRDMDHSAVNGQFVNDLVDGGPIGPWIIDLGCGPALIPILLCEVFEDDFERIGADWDPDEMRVMAVDSVIEMLEIAKFELEMAGRVEQIELQQVDLNDSDALDAEIADTIICNTVLHHLDDPLPAIRLAVNALKPGGRLFVRDLYRPSSDAEVETLVGLHGGAESTEGGLSSAQLLRQSLYAAFTLDEIRELLESIGVTADAVQMTSDRHWTIDWIKP